MDAFGERADAEHETSIAMAWHQANFQRASKLPSLKEIFRRMKPVEKTGLDGMMDQLKGYQAKREKIRGGNG